MHLSLKHCSKINGNVFLINRSEIQGRFKFSNLFPSDAPDSEKEFGVYLYFENEATNTDEFVLSGVPSWLKSKIEIAKYTFIHAMNVDGITKKWVLHPTPDTKKKFKQLVGTKLEIWND